LGNEKMQQAYAAAGDILRRVLEKERPDDARLLDDTSKDDVVIVKGRYDRVQDVFGILKVPYRLVDANEVSRLRLRPEQLLIINCPGQLEREGVMKVREFVEGGGSLFTTDWALKYVLEPAFPGIVAYNDRPTGDDVVRLDGVNHDNPFLEDVLKAGDDPQWWLEGSSYPIRILAPDRVKVLISSKELQQKYGESPIAILFHHGAGEVFHMISHYYLQRTELRTERHKAPAMAFAMAREVDPATMPAARLEGLSLGEAEAAYSSARFLTNILVEKRRKGRG
jgi:hypothetical protein